MSLNNLSIATPISSLDRSAQPGLIDQICIATQPKNRLAFLAGTALGAIVPTATYIVKHCETDAHPMMWLAVAGGLLYSANTVFDWARAAFKHPVKALGFVVILELVMTFSYTPWLSSLVLGYLVVINAIATGCNLIQDQKLSCTTTRRRRGGGS